MEEEIPEQDKVLPLAAHLRELRSRLLRCLALVAGCFLVLLYFANDLYEWVSIPLRRWLPPDQSMIATEVASPFLAPLKLALATAVVISMPYLLHQAWMFVSPGLYRREKSFMLPLLTSSILLFYLGIAFACFAVLPLVLRFFTFIGPQSVTVMTDISHYLDFVLKMLLAFGLAFEVPIAVLLAIRTGLTSAAALARRRPYIILLCFVGGMVLTPPDVVSQALLALPVWLLFECGILLGRRLGKRR